MVKVNNEEFYMDKKEFYLIEKWRRYLDKIFPKSMSYEEWLELCKESLS